MTTPAIPRSIEDVSTEWLDEALRRSGRVGEGGLSRVGATPIGTGQMCDSYRLELTGDLPDGAATSVVAKLPAENDTSRSTAQLLRSYEIEVRFYQQLAQELDIRTAAVIHADIDLETCDFVLLLEDLAPAVAGDQLSGCTVDEARRAVTELVGLHAPRWDDDAGLRRLEWLHRDPEASKGFLRTMLPTFWVAFDDRYGAVLGDEVREAADALLGDLDTHLTRDSRPWSVVHGDYRLDNLLFDPAGGRVAAVDWQTASHGPPVADLAYFLGAGLLPDTRRDVEVDLVRHYHELLVAAGVHDFPWDACWERYVQGTWAGLVMAVSASVIVEQTDRGDEMFLAMAHRHARHVHDAGAIEGLRQAAG